MRYIIHLFDNQFINPAADCASVADANCNSGKVVPFVCEDLRAEDELETMSREKLSTVTVVGSTDKIKKTITNKSCHKVLMPQPVTISPAEAESLGRVSPNWCLYTSLYEHILCFPTKFESIVNAIF